MENKLKKFRNKKWLDVKKDGMFDKPIVFRGKEWEKQDLINYLKENKLRAYITKKGTIMVEIKKLNYASNDILEIIKGNKYYIDKEKEEVDNMSKELFSIKEPTFKKINKVIYENTGQVLEPKDTKKILRKIKKNFCQK